MPENYEHIYYRDCPHFTDGPANQWNESGYLLHEGTVYSYEEDRKCQYGRTYSPMTPAEFLAYAKRVGIEIPEFFLEKMFDSENATGRTI